MRILNTTLYDVFDVFRGTSNIMSGLMKLFGVDKLQKLSQMVKEHGGIKGALYQIYWTDDLKVSLHKNGS